MYGLVNQGIRGLILEAHGESVWREIVAGAGLDHERFGEMVTYDDEVTFAVVASAAKVLDEPAEDLLFAFGKYWLLYTGSDVWSYLFELAGDDFLTFLGGLDDLHDRVQTMMPASRMPQFTLIRADDHVVLEYRSDRDGLAPMVLGLLAGLQDRFGERWAIEHIGKAFADGADRFEMRRADGAMERRAA